MDQQTRRYVKFNGYLIFACTFIFVLFQTWSLTVDTLNAQHQYVVQDESCLIRRSLVGRWVAAGIWFIALASYYMAMHWEDPEFLKPAMFLYGAEVLLVLTEDLLRTLRDDGIERFIKDGQYLLVFTAIVTYLMYTLHILQVIFQRTALKEKSDQCKVSLINGSGGSCAV